MLFNVKSIKRLPFIYKVVGDGLDDVNLRAQCGWLCVDELDVFMIRNWELFRTSGYAFTTSSGDLYMSNGTYRSSWDESTHRRYEKDTYGELNIERLLINL